MNTQLNTQLKHISRNEQTSIMNICDDLSRCYLGEPNNNYIRHYSCFVNHSRTKKTRDDFVSHGKSSAIKQYNTPSLHAEIDALKKLTKYYASQELDLIVVRFSNGLELLPSRPCYNCLKTLLNSNVRIKNIYYSDHGEICKEKFSTMIDNEITKKSSGVRHRDATRLKQNSL